MPITNVHTSPQMEAVLRAAKVNAPAFEGNLDEFAVAKALDKTWLTIEDDKLVLTANGKKVCELLKL